MTFEDELRELIYEHCLTNSLPPLKDVMEIVKQSRKDSVKLGRNLLACKIYQMRMKQELSFNEIGRQLGISAGKASSSFYNHRRYLLFRKGKPNNTIPDFGCQCEPLEWTDEKPGK